MGTGGKGRGLQDRWAIVSFITCPPLRRLLPHHTGTGGRLVLHPHPVQGLLSDKSACTASTILISVIP